VSGLIVSWFRVSLDPDAEIQLESAELWIAYSSRNKMRRDSTFVIISFDGSAGCCA